MNIMMEMIKEFDYLVVVMLFEYIRDLLERLNRKEALGNGCKSHYENRARKKI